MNFSSIAEWLTIIGLLLTIAGFAVALGKRDARLAALEDRCREDREKNSDQHREFYSARDDTLRASLKLEGVERTLLELKESLKEILDRLPDRRAP